MTSKYTSYLHQLHYYITMSLLFLFPDCNCEGTGHGIIIQICDCILPKACSWSLDFCRSTLAQIDHQFCKVWSRTNVERNPLFIYTSLYNKVHNFENLQLVWRKDIQWGSSIQMVKCWQMACNLNGGTKWPTFCLKYI